MEIKEIFFLEGYYATSDGNILDSQKKKLHKYKREDYYWVSIRNAEYKVSTLILTTFEPIPRYLKGLPVANHFNLDRSDDKLSNLDWVDRKWNAIHYFVMTADKEIKDSYIRVVKDGVSNKFGNLEEAAKFLDKPIRAVWDALKSQKALGGFKISYRSRVSETNSGYENNKSLARDSDNYGSSFTSVSRPIKIMDAKTGEIKEYVNMLSAAKDYSVKLTHIRNRLSTPEKPKIFKKRFIIIDADKDFDWVTEDIKVKLLDRGTKRVVVIDTEKLTFQVYESATSFVVKHSGFPKRRSKVLLKLKKGGVVKFKQFALIYLPEDLDIHPDLFIIFKLIGLKYSL